MKLLIVDDDPVIRLALKKIITESDLAIDSIMEAADGQAGLEKAIELLPDVIITDIRMPVMDGLTFLENIYKRLPDAKLIILTGYDEFDYAKKAIRFGVSEYLLKPYNNIEMLTILKNMLNIIAHEKKLNAQQNKIALFYRESQDALMERRLEALFSKSPFAEELTELLGSIAAGTIKPKYVLLHIAVDNAAVVCSRLYEDNSALMYYAVKNIADEIFAESFESISFRRERGGLISLLKFISREHEEKLRFDVEKLRYLSRKYLTHSLTVWICSPFESLCELPDRYKAAMRGIHQRLFYNGDVVLKETRLKMRSKEPVVDAAQQNQLLAAIRKHDSTRVSAWIDDYLVPLQHINDLDGYALKKVVGRLCIGLQLSLGKDALQQEHAEISSEANQIWDAETFGDLLRSFRKCCQDMMDAAQDQNPVGIQNRALLQAMRYIQENYAKEITLESLSALVWLNPSYLSELFKKELGVNFIDYLAKIRIEQAKSYLLDNKHKINEVASIVGYSNAEYFSKVFKKIVGMTPRDYQDHSI